MKIKVLGLLSRLCKSPNSEAISFPFRWAPLWNEAVALSTRAKKTESIASESLAMSLVKSIVHFLHEARHMTSAADAEAIVALAHDKLRDTRRTVAIEGVVLLVSMNSKQASEY